MKGTDFSDVSFHELMERSHVMTECSATDPEWTQQFAEQAVRLGGKASISYGDLGSLFHSAAGDKAVDFLMRHHLMSQFMKEEAIPGHSPK